jgi:hypothetical protein
MVARRDAPPGDGARKQPEALYNPVGFGMEMRVLQEPELYGNAEPGPQKR